MTTNLTAYLEANGQKHTTTVNGTTPVDLYEALLELATDMNGRQEHTIGFDLEVDGKTFTLCAKFTPDYPRQSQRLQIRGLVHSVMRGTDQIVASQAS